MVVLTALKDDVVENSRIGGLGAGELKVGASRYAMASSFDFTEFSFASDGLELYNFSEQEMINLNAIKEISKTLPRQIMQSRLYSIHQKNMEYYSNVHVIPTRNIVPRAAGCDETKCVIPSNPMMHMIHNVMLKSKTKLMQI
jgi:hypothetical protein